jgi:hypothetical protein
MVMSSSPLIFLRGGLRLGLGVIGSAEMGGVATTSIESGLIPGAVVLFLLVD